MEKERLEEDEKALEDYGLSDGEDKKTDNVQTAETLQTELRYRCLTRS